MRPSTSSSDNSSLDLEGKINLLNKTIVFSTADNIITLQRANFTFTVMVDTSAPNMLNSASKASIASPNLISVFFCTFSNSMSKLLHGLTEFLMSCVMVKLPTQSFTLLTNPLIRDALTSATGFESNNNCSTRGKFAIGRRPAESTGPITGVSPFSLIFSLASFIKVSKTTTSRYFIPSSNNLLSAMVNAGCTVISVNNFFRFCDDLGPITLGTIHNFPTPLARTASATPPAASAATSAVLRAKPTPALTALLATAPSVRVYCVPTS